MTRKEKIKALIDFCRDRHECRDCPILIPDGRGDCQEWPSCTDEEIDAAFAKLPDDVIAEAEKAAEKVANAVQAADMVNKPNHYQLPGGLECWDVLVACFGEEETKIWAKINAFTYLFRSKKKNGKEDIRKALANLKKYFELGGGCDVGEDQVHD